MGTDFGGGKSENCLLPLSSIHTYCACATAQNANDIKSAAPDRDTRKIDIICFQEKHGIMQEFYTEQDDFASFLYNSVLRL
ncbi:hypothetical protein UNDKW_2701 [Undibacterium sp. KW1]|nr:hypothetical protein UNDKW_2701 [Undibacterium sp. KW1]